jgi:hypothetical protein
MCLPARTEHSIVIAGEIGFRSDESEVVLGPGGYITKPRGQMRLIRVNRGAAVWFWMALAVIGGCRPTVLGGVDSRAS